MLGVWACDYKQDDFFFFFLFFFSFFFFFIFFIFFFFILNRLGIILESATIATFCPVTETKGQTPDEDQKSKALVFFIFFTCKVSTFLWSCSIKGTRSAEFFIRPVVTRH